MTIFRDFQGSRPRRDIGIARPRHVPRHPVLVGVVGVEFFLGNPSRKIMLNSDSQSFAGMEGFSCHEQITKVYCWSK